MKYMLLKCSSSDENWEPFSALLIGLDEADEKLIDDIQKVIEGFKDVLVENFISINASCHPEYIEPIMDIEELLSEEEYQEFDDYGSIDVTEETAEEFKKHIYTECVVRYGHHEISQDGVSIVMYFKHSDVIVETEVF